MDKRILYIRADANDVLGMGHLMRSFVLAAEWEKMYGKCCFLTGDSISEQLVISYGYEAVNLHGFWDNLDYEIPVLVGF